MIIFAFTGNSGKRPFRHRGMIDAGSLLTKEIIELFRYTMKSFIHFKNQIIKIKKRRPAYDRLFSPASGECSSA